jgi:dihydrodipicolinate synthase/N-acetylneuraminate lyase
MCQAVVDRFVDGDLAGAADMYAKVLAVTDVIDTGRLVSADGPKAAMKALGYDVGPPRHPRVPVDDATIEKMRLAFERMGTRQLEESLSSGL